MNPSKKPVYIYVGWVYIPSGVSEGHTINKERAANTIRISLSYLTTEEEIDTFLKVFDECYNHLLLKKD